MLSKSDRELGDQHQKGWMTPEGSSKGFSAKPIPARSITPKGTLFDNLGEAHQAITAKLASRSAGNLNPNASPRDLSGSSTRGFITAGSVDSLPSAQHMEFAKTTYTAHGPCLTPFFAALSTTSESHNKSTSCSGRDSGKDVREGSVEDVSANQSKRRTINSVEEIYEQYLPSASIESLPWTDDLRSIAEGGGATGDKDSLQPHQPSDCSQDHMHEHAQNSISTEVRRTAHGIDAEKVWWKMHYPPSEPPRAPLPELPQVREVTQHSVTGSSDDRPDHSSARQSLVSVADSQKLLGWAAEHHSNRLGTAQMDHNVNQESARRSNSAQLTSSSEEASFMGHGTPSPCHAQGYPGDQLDHECTRNSNAGLSTADFTGSDEDPFEYDRGSYNIFLQPARERDVSAALHCMSGVSTNSGEDHPKNPPAFPSEEFATAPVPGFSAKDTAQIGNKTIRSNNPFFNRLKFYHDSAVHYAWDCEDDTNQVKIPVGHSPMPLDRPEQPAANPNGFSQNLAGVSTVENIHSVTSEGGDWVTVATPSEGQFDSTRALASDSELNGSYPVNITGSSIADYTDGSSFRAGPYDPISSTERILQHPGRSSAHTTLHRETLRDTCRPIFLPKPRVHRVNGYFQDSSRYFTDTTTGSSSKTSTSGKSSTRSYLVDKLRTRGIRKHKQRGNPYGSMGQWSRFGSRDSIFGVDMERNSAAIGRHHQEKWSGTPQASAQGLNWKTVANQTEPERDCHAKTNERLLEARIPDESPAGGQGRASTSTHANRSLGPLGPASPTLFSFPLITLEEAARLQALKRESGEDDQTYISSTRTRKDSSGNASKQTQRTTPLTPYIKPPPPIHCHRRTPMGIPSSAVPYPGHPHESQQRSIIRHGRNTYVSSFCGGKSPVPAQSVLSRSFRNPFGSVYGSGRSTLSFPGTPSVFDPPRLLARDRRNYGRRTPMTPDPRQIADLEIAPASDDLSDDAYLSWQARRRRQAYYYLMCALCIFPFTALLAYKGTFDSALSWYTKGETAQLSRQQRRNVLVLGSVVSVVWLLAAAILVTLAVSA
ncbi:hypothetical protein VTK56DRAFT_882 [Thermocarpiscus australiensis]